MIRQEISGKTAFITIDNVRKRNAVSREDRESILESVRELELNDDVRVVVIAGADGNFCSGADVEGIRVDDLYHGRQRYSLNSDLVRAVCRSSKPFIAAVDGWCAGAGLSIALCCDTIVASNGAKFLSAFGKIGLIADMGLLETLPARVGVGRARQILLYNEVVTAEEAMRIGLIDHCVEVEELLPTTMRLAERLAIMPPTSIALTKSFLSRCLEPVLDWEREMQTSLHLSPDFQSAMQVFNKSR